MNIRAIKPPGVLKDRAKALKKAQLYKNIFFNLCAIVSLSLRLKNEDITDEEFNTHMIRQIKSIIFCVAELHLGVRPKID